KNSLAVIDAEEHKLVREIPVGAVPFGVAVSNRQGRVFVSNRGGRKAGAQDQVAWSSGQAIVSDRKTGAATTRTLRVVDLKSGAVSDVEVGLAPSQIALNADESVLAVANSHSDSVSLIDAKSLRRTDIKIPAYPADTLGSLPDALAFSPDGNRLYVSS